MNKIAQAQQRVEAYFQATYYGKEYAIRDCFHPDATISGFIEQQFYSWPIDTFIANVMKRPIAADNNEKYDKQVLSIEINGHIAIVKACNLVGDIYFTDQINLIWLDEQWKIMSKTFTGH